MSPENWLSYVESPSLRQEHSAGVVGHSLRVGAQEQVRGEELGSAHRDSFSRGFPVQCMFSAAGPPSAAAPRNFQAVLRVCGAGGREGSPGPDLRESLSPLGKVTSLFQKPPANY